MWLACALIILFSVGFVLPCMLDITTTPDSEFTVLGKGMWLMVVGAFWIFGAAAWLIVGRPQGLGLARRSGGYEGRFGQAQAVLRHPATQAAGGYGEPGTWSGDITEVMPVGPDDDEDFLEELNRRIRETGEDG
jgi:hypothetical protein